MKLTDEKIIEALENRKRIRRKDAPELEYSRLDCTGRLRCFDIKCKDNFWASITPNILRADDWEIIE